MIGFVQGMTTKKQKNKMTGFVLNMAVFAFDFTGFSLRTTGFVPIMTGCVLYMKIFVFQYSHFAELNTEDIGIGGKLHVPRVVPNY